MKKCIAFACNDCGIINVIETNKPDGNTCIQCGGILLGLGNAVVKGGSNNIIDYQKQYYQEVELFNNIAERYSSLVEEDIKGAFKLMRDSLQAYNRWASIKYDIKKGLVRGQGTAAKERMEEICRYLKEIHVTSRMIWSRGKDDLITNREC